MKECRNLTVRHFKSSNVLVLRKFRHSIAIVERAIKLARKGGRSERDKLGRRRSTKLIIPPRSDARPLQFIAEIVKLRIQHDYVARFN